ncbi:hypothetical protein J7M28_03105 [bacterium]|nr:hypothetical protein [bacterium]
MTRLFGCFLACVLILCLSGSAIYGAEYDVNWDETGDFVAIQDALDVAVDGDIITVHTGTYCENIHFDGKNVTLRSLDPEDEQVVASTIIDGGELGSVVKFVGPGDDTCVISGFTITNGKAGHGGGLIDCYGTIMNCTIRGNSVSGGGGGLWYCSGPIIDCTIRGNSVGGDSGGGGLSHCNGTIANCTISENSVNSSAGGGGLSYCNGTIVNCLISENRASARDYSGGVSAGRGGGLSGCGGTIMDCTITGNYATRLGGGLCDCSGTIANCTINGNSAGSGGYQSDHGGGLCYCDGTISNCMITQNRSDYGGGLYKCNGTISNCTISENDADSHGLGSGGGLVSCEGSIVNTIVWGNKAQGHDELHACTGITNCCIRDWTGGGEGNISVDPLFVTGPLGNYYLSSCAAGQNADSPCIDAGSDTAESFGLDKFTTRTDHVLDSGIVDMGYHYPVASDQNPYVVCSLNSSEFRPGDALVGFIEAHNPGPDIIVDAYLGFVMPDGAIISLTNNGFAIGIYPWIFNVFLPSGLDFGPSEVFSFPVLRGPGTYLLAVALTEPGQFDFIGEPCLFPFTITE